MKHLLTMLMYVTGFIQGQFAEALKQVFNVESVKFVDKDKDGVSFIKLDGLLRHLQSTFGAEISQMYMFLMFLNIIKNGKLLEFFNLGYQGEKLDTGYYNINLIMNYITNYLQKMIFTSDKNEASLIKFFNILESIPTGIVKVLKDVKCEHCDCGVVTDPTGVIGDVECNVCGGEGVVEQWHFEGNELTDEYLLELQNNLSEFAPIVAKILDDYIQYYVSNYIYRNHFYVDTQRTTDTTFHYNGGTFTTPFYCDLKSSGTFPDKNIRVVYTYNGVEFTIPLLVMHDRLVEKSESKFHSTEPVEETVEVSSHTVTRGDISETKSTFSYNKKDGTPVYGHGDPKDWTKYYEGTYGNLKVYFDASRYSRDEVRQAFAGIAGVAKSQISVKTVTV